MSKWWFVQVRKWALMSAMLIGALHFAEQTFAENARSDQSGPGFGGQWEDETEEEACRMQNDDGEWVSCNEMLQASQLAVGTVEKAAAKVDPMPSLPKAGPAQTEGTKPRANKASPFDVIASSAQAERPTPLAQARDAYAALIQEEESLRRKGATSTELRTFRRGLRLEQLVMLHLEELAYRRMQRCIAEHRLPPITTVKTHRMTSAGPIPLTGEELAAFGPQIEPYPCERVRVVDEDLVSSLRRYYVVSRSLHEDDFGWNQRDQRAALTKEKKVLVKKLQPDDPLLSHRPAPDWRLAR